MRRFLSSLLLGMLAIKSQGCGGGEPPKAPANPEASNPNLPGVPTEGPEAPKAKR